MEINNQKRAILGVRHVQVLLLFLGFIVSCMIRLNCTIAVVAMTNAKTSNPDFPEYEWTGKQKSYIISSIYWSFTISQVVGAMVCRRLGTKPTLLLSMMAPAILSLITPLSIPLGGWEIYCGIRFVEGLFQGMFFPSVYEHIAKWSPIEERTRLGSISNSGLLIGTILAMMVSGFVAKSSFGWPGISYVAGGLGLIWCVLWLMLSDNSPSSSRLIGSVERDYILASQKKTSNEERKNITIPWRCMLTSVPCWSLMIVFITQTWSYSTMVFEIPLFMHGILKMDIKSNAFFSGLPFLAMFLMHFVYLIAMELIMKKNIISALALRKIINSISMWIPSLTLFYIGFLDDTQKSLAIVLLIVTLGFGGGQNIATGFNAIDLTPNFAVIIMGIIYTILSVVAIVIPILTGIIVNDETNQEQWRVVFLIASLLNFFGNLQFLFFGSDKTQFWNDEENLESPSSCETQKNSKTNQTLDVEEYSK